MLISVIVCTYNRCQTLSEALASIAESRVPNLCNWEILVVDNNSSDHTREVVEDFCRRYPGRFRYLFEKHQGHSASRNAGIRGTRGEIVVFTDDDVTVEPDWLWNLAAPLSSGEWAGAGGRIVPLWDRPRPRWLPSPKMCEGPLVSFDLGPVPLPLTLPPVGANMAFRREVFEKYGDFRTDLGRCGERLRGGDDTDFGLRLLAAGERLLWVPSAVLYHPVPENRLRKEYFLSWFFENAHSNIAMFGTPAEARLVLAGVPVVLFRRLARWSFQWLVTLQAQDRFFCKSRVWSVAGTISGCYELSRTRRQARPGAASSSESIP